jgi:hypothetical protein
MLTIILGYILMGLIPILCYFRQYKALLIIGLLSEYTECFALIFGSFKVTADAYIGFIFFITHINFFIKEKTIIGKFLWAEYFWVIGIGFLFLLSPWKDSAASLRTWTQSQTGRTFVGVIRMIEPILVFYFFYYLFFLHNITLQFFLKTISYLAICSVIVGIADTFFLEGLIKSQFHFLEREVLSDRFTGLFVEPRYLARILGITMMTLLCLKDTIVSRNAHILFIIAIFCCLAGIGMSMSSSAIATTSISFVVYIIIFRVKIKNIALYAVFLVLGLFIILQNEQFVTHTTSRLAIVTVEEEEREIANVPAFISSFEANDACALAFFYTNPKHLLWGVGPNTICIPANEFMAPYTEKMLDFNLNNPPYTFLIYYFSRSGILGVVCYFFVFGMLIYSLWKTNKIYSKCLMICFTFFFISCNNFNFIFAVLGIMSAVYQQTQKGLASQQLKQWV